ncbi:phosphatidylglycerol lysyltransferase domain-containing protein [Octadecabacter sp. 1_MG-2023]|uniref:phosphatidylglycerol lysyltransferase domain-containing protein n=1 Tax=unclassified Octadecabacter TaxID=196158 RepID=UPI001C099B19|nr:MULTISPECIES: phosphatidylglycerol lysyltransferase domain-containing protein [unclassified Octadecabacter]MBU2993557.1 DUF2156 domain-containing protein [Octadecabacter sp. B2R22]MDO6735599.1 phosphatidylglycerol lysyltransferase domain-containing protein [Octadecabacter sp. 1_MG-2023]
MATGEVPSGPIRTGFDRVTSGSMITNLLPLAALVLFGTLFIKHISGLDPVMIWAAIDAMAPWQWLVALIFTALSFRAVGTYDVLVHAVLRTGQRPKAARAAGIKAIALSQTLGFGALTGALVRWRCLPDVPLGKVLRLSAVVSLSFLAALAVVCALVVPLSGLLDARLVSNSAVFFAGILAIPAMIALARLAHHLRWIPAPVGAGTLIALLTATFADTAFAAGALWVLWPDAVPYHLLFAAYLVALGAGLLSNAPGGVGAFDLSLLAMLPVTDDASAMAAVLAFRLLYYALPAAIALIGLLRPNTVVQDITPDHPEAGLLKQSAQLSQYGQTSVLTLPCLGGGAVLGDLPAGAALAARPFKHPKTLYKCSPEQASQARAAGWAVLRCAQDAVIRPQTWSPDRPACRQLRRALRHFETSGLTISEVRDMAHLRPVAENWVASHGREKGHSMGLYCPDYLSSQRVFAAFDGSTPVAFVSFHTGDVWTLDLMRHEDAIPDGTMHALIVTAIHAAREGKAAFLSLASVPAFNADLPFANRIMESSAGLRRFKASFGPEWKSRYICAKGPLRLILAGASLTYSIHFPAKIQPTEPDYNSIQRHDEDYSIAPIAPPCEAQSRINGALTHDKRPQRTAFNT